MENFKRDFNEFRSDRGDFRSFFEQATATENASFSDALRSHHSPQIVQFIDQILLFLGDGLVTDTVHQRALALLYALVPDSAPFLPAFDVDYFFPLLREYLPDVVGHKRSTDKKNAAQLRQKRRELATKQLQIREEKIVRKLEISQRLSAISAQVAADNLWFTSERRKLLERKLIDESYYSRRRAHLMRLKLENTALVKRLSAAEMAEFNRALGLADSAHNFVEVSS